MDQLGGCAQRGEFGMVLRSGVIRPCQLCQRLYTWHRTFRCPHGGSLSSFAQQKLLARQRKQTLSMAQQAATDLEAYWPTWRAWYAEKQRLAAMLRVHWQESDAA